MSSVYNALTKADKKNETISALSSSWQALSLEGKITIAVLGVVFLIIVSQLVGRVLRAQMAENAVVMTTNLSDAAAGHLAARDILKLHTAVTKYARLSRVAYVFIRDRDGKVIAHSLESLPQHLEQELASYAAHEVGRRELTVQGKTVYETREPILDGRLGSAHIGIWADAVALDVYQALFLFVWPVTLAILAALIIVAVLARPLIQALRRLIELRAGSRAPHPLR